VSPRFSEEQRKSATGRGSNPRSRANLKPFKPGESGNAGGVKKGTVFLAEAYKRLLALPVDEFCAYKPTSIAEEIAMEQIERARGRRREADPLPAAKEICDRTEGRATQRIADVNNGPMKIEVVWVKRGLAGEGEDEEQGP
jgi:hypothetical protein